MNKQKIKRTMQEKKYSLHFIGEKQWIKLIDEHKQKNNTLKAEYKGTV